MSRVREMVDLTTRCSSEAVVRRLKQKFKSEVVYFEGRLI